MTRNDGTVVKKYKEEIRKRFREWIFQTLLNGEKMLIGRG